MHIVRRIPGFRGSGGLRSGHRGYQHGEGRMFVTRSFCAVSGVYLGTYAEDHLSTDSSDSRANECAEHDSRVLRPTLAQPVRACTGWRSMCLVRNKEARFVRTADALADSGADDRGSHNPQLCSLQ